MRSLWKGMASVSLLVLAVGGGRALGQHDQSGHGGQTAKPEQPAKPSAALPMCPVMGDEPINLAASLATPDGPVFFCCKDCIPKYQADPAKYATKVTAQRQALADRPKVQVVCPACEQPADPKITAEIGGRKISFSSAECMEKYRSDPAKYAFILANGFTYQTKCPVMDEAIDPKSFTKTASGFRIYFCCMDCEKKLFAEPAKYTPKLAAQGLTFDANELTPTPPKDEPGHGHGDHDHGR